MKRNTATQFVLTGMALLASACTSSPPRHSQLISIDERPWHEPLALIESPPVGTKTLKNKASIEKYIVYLYSPDCVRETESLDSGLAGWCKTEGTVYRDILQHMNPPDRLMPQ